MSKHITNVTRFIFDDPKTHSVVLAPAVDSPEELPKPNREQRRYYLRKLRAYKRMAQRDSGG